MSNDPDAVLVQMIGTIPMASEIALTRSSVTPSHAVSPPSTHRSARVCGELTNIPVWWTHRCWCNTKHGLDGLACPTEFSNNLLVCQGCQRLIEKRPPSARNSKGTRTGRARWDQVCTLISWPAMNSSTNTAGSSTTREPTTKKVALIFFVSR